MTLAVKDNIELVEYFEAGSFYSSKYSIKKVETQTTRWKRRLRGTYTPRIHKEHRQTVKKIIQSNKEHWT